MIPADAGDSAALSKTAHALNGLARQFGAMRVSGLAFALESEASTGKNSQNQVGNISITAA